MVVLELIWPATESEMRADVMDQKHAGRAPAFEVVGQEVYRPATQILEAAPMVVPLVQQSEMSYPRDFYLVGTICLPKVLEEMTVAAVPREEHRPNPYSNAASLR